MNVSERFEHSIGWLEQLSSRPHRPPAEVGLERARFLLKQCGDPHRDFRAVHVAGSTGKGSTTTMVGSILQASGRRTGYFRSPHLESYRERIAVGDRWIDEISWLRVFDQVAAVSERMESGAYSGYHDGRPTLFEVLFAMATLYFREQAVEWAAVETGMGGRLDATNTIDSEVAVVTNISLEHTQVLGKTLEAIAAEKAAIIKVGCHAVTGILHAGSLAVIERRAQEQDVPLALLQRDFAVTGIEQDERGQSITLSDTAGDVPVRLGVVGGFQATNAALAFGAARALRRRGVLLDDRALVRGLEDARMPGRFEVLAGEPTVVLDGAHNPAAMHALREALVVYFSGRRISLLFAAMIDKDVQAMAREIIDLVDIVVTTQAPGTARAASADSLAAHFSSAKTTPVAVDDPSLALRTVHAATRSEDVLVVAGSLYLVGWARERLATSGVGA